MALRILGQYINYKVPINSHYLFIFVNWFFLDDSHCVAHLICFVKGSLWRGYRTRCYGLQKVNIFSIFSSLYTRLLVTNWANTDRQSSKGVNRFCDLSHAITGLSSSDVKSLHFLHLDLSLTLFTVNILYVQLLRRQPVHWNLSRALSLR